MWNTIRSTFINFDVKILMLSKKKIGQVKNKNFDHIFRMVKLIDCRIEFGFF